VALRAKKLKIVEFETAAIDERNYVVDFELPSPGLSIDKIKRVMAASLAVISVALDEQSARCAGVVVGPPVEYAVGFIVAPVVPVSLASCWAVFDALTTEATTSKLSIVVRQSGLAVRRS
jgi:hypothetical protein